jgi:hypothetical protein
MASRSARCAADLDRGPFAVDEIEADAEWFERQQQIREQDGRVHLQPAHGLERHLGR